MDCSIPPHDKDGHNRNGDEHGDAPPGSHAALPNGLRLSGERKRVRCSRGFGGLIPELRVAEGVARSWPGLPRLPFARLSRHVPNGD